MVRFEQGMSPILQAAHVRGHKPPCPHPMIFARPDDLERTIAAIEIHRRERLFCGFGGGSHNEKIPRRLYCPGYGSVLMNLPS